MLWQERVRMIFFALNGTPITAVKQEAFELMLLYYHHASMSALTVEYVIHISCASSFTAMFSSLVTSQHFTLLQPVFARLLRMAPALFRQCSSRAEVKAASCDLGCNP